MFLRPVAVSRRTMVLTSQRFERSAVAERLGNLYDQVVSTNWADPVNLALDVPFWEAESAKVSTMVEPFLSDESIGPKNIALNRALDCFYACEDIRDFINEIGEVGSRSTGVMGTGFAAGPKIDNLDEIAEKIVKEYEELKTKYPEYRGKIEQSIGHGLATLRTKSKFRYEEMHRYFF
jgi:hypothetical protein